VNNGFYLEDNRENKRFMEIGTYRASIEEDCFRIYKVILADNTVHEELGLIFPIEDKLCWSMFLKCSRTIVYDELNQRVSEYVQSQMHSNEKSSCSLVEVMNRENLDE
jgi:hypothetical protein